MSVSESVFPKTCRHIARRMMYDAATGFAAVATRSRADCWSMEDRRRPYPPNHSPSHRYDGIQGT